jgi:Fic family protein
MDPSLFSDASTGRLVRELDGWAYIPAPLPPALLADWEVSTAVEDARHALARLTTVAGFVQNTELIMRPFRQREAILSSSIEGTQTQVRELVESQADPTRRLAEDSDLFEVLNYLRALEYGNRWVSEGRPLTLAVIRGLHAELMSGVRGQNKHPGEFRPGTVSIGGTPYSLKDARFVPLPAENVTPLMVGLIEFAQSPPTYGDLIDCAILHYQFETIHPFEDGNGRIGRLLIPLMLQVRGVMSRPVLYLSPYFEKQRDVYQELLMNVSTRNDWKSWLLYFLRAVKSQSDESTNRIHRVLDLQQDYKRRATSLVRGRVAALLAIDLIMEQVVVAVRDIESYTQTSNPTARTAVQEMVRLGILRPDKQSSRGQLWVAEELLQSVYEA